jgi:plastocyanin domain-containing protein
MRADRETALIWSTRGTDTCARTVVIPNLHEQLILPASGQVPLKLPPQKKGTVLHYSCSMGMYDGQIIFDAE